MRVWYIGVRQFSKLFQASSILVALSICSHALAQHTEYVPPQSGANDVCVARAYNPAQLDSCRFIHTIVNKGTPRPFAWNNLLLLDNNADNGESTGQYIKANQWGQGATWAQVLQIQCHSATGDNCYGQEIDLQAPNSGEVRGYGIMQYVGRANATGQPLPDSVKGHAAVGYGLYASYGQWDKVDVQVGVDIQVHCTIACVRVQSGEKIALDTGGAITLSFDAQTGYLVGCTLGQPIFGFNMSTGHYVNKELGNIPSYVKCGN